MEKTFNKDKFTKYLKTELFNQIQQEQRRIGLREFAGKIGISAPTLSRLENGNVPDVESFIKVCVWMDVSPSTFINNPKTEL